MPREKRTGVTQTGALSAVTRPSEELTVIGRRVPQVVSQSAGEEQLGAVFQSFFGDLAGAAQTIQDVEHAARMADIQEENKKQAEQAQSEEALGAPIDPALATDRDYIETRLKLKNARAAAADWPVFEQRLRQMPLGTDMNGALANFINEKMKGAAPEDLAHYSRAMLQFSSRPMADHQANLVQAKAQEGRDDFSSSIHAMLASGAPIHQEDILERMRDAERFFPADKKGEARSWAIGQFMNAAHRSGKLPFAVAMLELPEPRTPENPQGLSFAQRFPEAFDQMAQEAERHESWTYQQVTATHLDRIDQALAAQDVRSATAMLSDFKEHYGENPQFRARRIQLIQLLQKGIQRDVAFTKLQESYSTGRTADPEIIEKYGAEYLDVIKASGGMPAVIGHVRAWGKLPKDVARGLSAALVNTGNPAEIAEAYDSFAKPMLAEAPTILNEALDTKAEFVTRFIRQGQILGNQDSNALAATAAKALDTFAKNNDDPQKVVFWKGQEGGRQAWLAGLEKDAAGRLQARFKGPFFTRLFKSGRVRVSQDILESALGHAQTLALLNRYAGMGDGDAAARDAVLEKMEQHGNLTAIINAEGDYVIQENLTPKYALNEDGSLQIGSDGQPVSATWAPYTDPDGKLQDPNEVFVNEVSQFGLVTNGRRVGLMRGPRTSIDGGMVVTHDGLSPIRLAPGVSFTYRDALPENIVPGAPAPSPFRLVESKTVTPPKDPAAFEAWATEFFKGTGLRAAYDSTPIAGMPAYRIEYVWRPQQPPTAEILATEEAARIAAEAASEEPTPALAAPVTEVPERSTEESSTESFFLTRAMRGIASTMQSKGKLESTFGVTKTWRDKPTSAESLIDSIFGGTSKTKLNRGGKPLLSNTTPADLTYQTARIAFMQKHEGVRDRVYGDEEGTPTVGIGLNLNEKWVQDLFRKHGIDHVEVRKGKRKLTPEQIEATFNDAVEVAERIVSRTFPKTDLTQDQRLVLVSLAFHGKPPESKGSLLGPNLRKHIENQEWLKVVNAIALHSNADKSAGIQKRRINEARTFARGSGLTDAQIAPIIAAAEAKRIAFRTPAQVKKEAAAISKPTVKRTQKGS